MSPSTETFERLEMKYWVSERVADQVRATIEGFCIADAHNLDSARGYPVSSLYFDTPSLLFHRQKLREDPDRIKLRARSYGGGPVFFEIKRKRVDVVQKSRVVVPRENWHDAVSGFGAPLDESEEARRQLDAFAHLMAQSGSEPTLLVHYEQEAYASTVDPYARVTFDRSIRASACRELSFDTTDARWADLDGANERSDDHTSPTLLELKSERLVPLWMIDLVRRFDLRRTGFSKYSEGIIATRNAELGLGLFPRGAYE